MDFSSPFQVRASCVRPAITSTAEALRFIDRELVPDVRSLPRWTFARALLEVAEASGKKRDLVHAYRQFRQALSSDRLLSKDALPEDREANEFCPQTN